MKADYEQIDQLIAKAQIIQNKIIELTRLAELGQAVIKGHEKIKSNIPCKGIYGSEPCKEINTYTLGCSLRYFCELQIKDGVS